MKALIEKKIQYEDTNVNYYVSGNSEGETIVFLHPAFGDHKIFKRQFEYFQEKYFLIAIDMVGHGNSQVTSEVTIGDMPQIIKGILDDNGIHQIHLVGVSMGSLIGQSFASQFSTHVKTVTIVGGYSIHKDNKDILKKQQKEFLKWLFYIIFSMKKFRRYVIAMSVKSEEGKKLFGEGIQKFTRKSFKAMQGMNKTFLPKEEPVTYPLLILCGEYDIELLKSAGKRLAKLEPKSHYAEIKESGHCANIDNAPVFNQYYKQFIETDH